MNDILDGTPLNKISVFIFEILCLENFYSTEWMVWVLALYTEYGDKKILYIKQTKHNRLKLEKK